MLNEPVNIFGLFNLTFAQLLILTSFFGLVLGYVLAVAVNRRRRLRAVDDAVDVTEIKERAASNLAFMKGINYILSDRPERAIEELTRAVNLETDTVETYVALGNLFRSRGEIERAIRIRQSIILRPNLSAAVRDQALFDLALDYRAGGFFERALKTFKEVLEKDSRHLEAHAQLIQLYEEMGDWETAYVQQEKMSRVTGKRATHILAHYRVEIGKQYLEKGSTAEARSAFKKALAQDPSCVDAYLHLGDVLLLEGRPKKAVAAWHKILEAAPDMVFLTFGRLAAAAAHMNDLRSIEEFLDECSGGRDNPLANLALARLLAQRGENERAILELSRALEIDADLVEARKELGLLLLAWGRADEALSAYRDLLEHLTAPEAIFQCGNCGFSSRDLLWRCPQCFSWDTMTLSRHRPLLFGMQPLTKDLVVVGPGEEYLSPGDR